MFDNNLYKENFFLMANNSSQGIHIIGVVLHKKKFSFLDPLICLNIMRYLWKKGMVISLRSVREVLNIVGISTAIFMMIMIKLKDIIFSCLSSLSISEYNSIFNYLFRLVY